MESIAMVKQVLQESIADKIEKLLRSGLSIAEMARRSGLRQDSFYKWKSGIQPGGKIYEILKSYLDNEWQSFLEKERGNMAYREMENFPISLAENQAAYNSIARRFAIMRLSLRTNQQPLPVLNNNALAAGTIIHDNEEPELVVDFIDAPFLGAVAGVVEVTGEHMHPTFKQGSRIAISRISDSHILNWGDCYFIIDKNWQSIIRRVYPGKLKNTLLLLSDNPDKEKYPPVTRQLHDIEAIFKVNAVIAKY